MVKIVLLLAVIAAAFVADATCQRYIQPTFRPPGRPPIILPTYRPPLNRGPVIRRVREANDEPLWLWQGDDIQRAPSTADNPILPSAIDHIKLDPHRRYARSKDSPSAKSYGGGRSSGSSRGDTGPTHPGYNRRNARSIRRTGFRDPWRPRVPSPFNPNPRPGRPFPIYARTARDIQFPGIRKPSYRDVIIPNWNPNARTNPWNSLGGRRMIRSLENPGKEDEVYHDYYDVVKQEEPPRRPPLVLPTWLWQENNTERAPSTSDSVVLPSVVEDVKLDPHKRYTRSKDSPSAKSYGGGRSPGGSRGDTGPTHPGSNRRNARSIRQPGFEDPWPQPWRPRVPSPFDPFNPRPGRPVPIYARTARDIQFPRIKNPSHRDVIIPNWNPNARTNPWNSLGRRRNTRSLGNPGKEDEVYHDYYDVVKQEE